MRLLGLIVTTLLLAACEVVPSPQNAAKANEGWQRLRTEHFDVTTDLAPADAQVAAQSLERTRHALLAAAWNRADDRITERTTVVVFRTRDEYAHYQKERSIGLYVALGRPTIFLSGTPNDWEKRTAISDESTTSVLRHELTHRLAAGVYGRQPRWFAEGLAMFLETMSLSPDGKTATIGRVNLVALYSYNKFRDSSVADILAWRSDTPGEENLQRSRYGTSFLLVHYLYNTMPVQFATYQKKLATGVDPNRAFTESFPGLVPAALDQELNRYSKFGKFTEFQRPVDDIQIAPSPAKITAADVLAIRGQLAIFSSFAGSMMNEEAHRDIEEALKLETGNVLALRVSQAMDHTVPKDAVVRLRAQTAQRPDDAEAWGLLATLLPIDAPEREAAARKATALEPRNATLVNDLAWLLASTGRAEAALPLATKAALLAPWNPRILDTYAVALFGVSRCPEALATEKRALDLLTEENERADPAVYTKKIAEYEEACGAKNAP